MSLRTTWFQATEATAPMSPSLFLDRVSDTEQTVDYSRMTDCPGRRQTRTSYSLLIAVMIIYSESTTTRCAYYAVFFATNEETVEWLAHDESAKSVNSYLTWPYAIHTGARGQITNQETSISESLQRKHLSVFRIAEENCPTGPMGSPSYIAYGLATVYFRFDFDITNHRMCENCSWQISNRFRRRNASVLTLNFEVTNFLKCISFSWTVYNKK
jgi:hypothetical protein